jgi:hypothetical protein
MFMVYQKPGTRVTGACGRTFALLAQLVSAYHALHDGTRLVSFHSLQGNGKKGLQTQSWLN